jgi:predicted neutral ceramidase superfamily lipid hydrolase
MELMLGTVALAPIIVALVQVFKALGVPSKYAPWFNAALSVLAYALIVAVERDPMLAEPVNILLNALVIFLSAAGLYETARYAVFVVRGAGKDEPPF